MTSANNTVVLAGSGGSLVDVAGNVWTISSADTVLANGVPAGYTANVSEIAYVGVVWHENTSSQWFSWTGFGWQLGSDPLTPTNTDLAEIVSQLKELTIMSTTVGQDVTQLTTDVATLTSTVSTLSTAVTGLITAFEGAAITPEQEAAIVAADQAVQQANAALAADETAISNAENPPPAS